MSNSTYDCGDRAQYRNVPVGLLFIVHTLLYYPFYIPCAIVIMRQPLIAQSGYKIMGALAVVDMCGLLGNGLAAGLWSVVGVSFCDLYWPMKVIGAYTNSCWITYCALCVSLSINRATDFTAPTLNFKLFDGRKTYYWIAGSVTWGAIYLISYLTPACTLIYHAGWGTYLFDPTTPAKMGKWMNTFTDVLAPAIMIVCYVSLGKRIYALASGVRNAAQAQDNVTRNKRRVTVTAMLICVLATYTALSYPVLQTLNISTIWVFTLTHFLWQMTNGSNCFIYLFLNKTIRKEVKHLLGMERRVAPASQPAGRPSRSRRSTRNHPAARPLHRSTKF